MFLFYLSLNLKPQAVDEVTVDPVQDDIEIVNEGEGTDAFAVSIYLNPSNPDSDQHQISPCNINAYSIPEVMRIKDMITQGEFSYASQPKR